MVCRTKRRDHRDTHVASSRQNVGLGGGLFLSKHHQHQHRRRPLVVVVRQSRLRRRTHHRGCIFVPVVCWTQRRRRRRPLGKTTNNASEKEEQSAFFTTSTSSSSDEEEEKKKRKQRHKRFGTSGTRVRGGVDVVRDDRRCSRVWGRFVQKVTSTKKPSKAYPPGPDFDSAIEMGQNPLKFIEKVKSRYGPVAGVRLAGENVVVVSKPSVAETGFNRRRSEALRRKVPRFSRLVD